MSGMFRGLHPGFDRDRFLLFPAFLGRQRTVVPQAQSADLAEVKDPLAQFLAHPPDVLTVLDIAGEPYRPADGACLL